MKSFVILILAVLLLSSACTTNLPTANKILAPLTPVSLTSVTAKIHTTSNDKDDDTKVDIALADKNNKLVADAKNIFGKYEENSDHSLQLEKKGDFVKADLESGTLKIHIAPDGKDQWDFNLTLEFKFSDGTTVSSQPLNGNVMTEKSPDLTLVVDLGK